MSLNWRFAVSFIDLYIYIYIYMCVCVCVCVHTYMCVCGGELTINQN